jgi:MOSC domain-containing protein YiiM
VKNFKIISINVSLKKGEKKTPVASAKLQVSWGIVGDAHAGKTHRQISLLADEDIDEMRKPGIKLMPGDFAENITTQGISLSTLPVGTRIAIGETVLEITQIGKECHKGCAIREQVGDCIMPRKGVFAKVVNGGGITNESIGSYGF